MPEAKVDIDFLDLPSGPGMLQLLTTGFAWTSVLWTAVELGVFDALDRALDRDTIAARLGLPPEPLGRLLGALTAVRLLEADEGPDGSTRYQPTPVATLALARSGPRSIAPLLVQNQRQLYELFMHLPDAVRSGAPQLSQWRLHRAGASTCYESLVQQPAEYARMLEAMDAACSGVAEVLDQQAELADVLHLVDLGHGGGRIARELLAMRPQLRITAVDLGPALELARARAEAAGVADRIRFVEADLRRPLGGCEPAQAVLLSGVISDFTPSDRELVLQSAHDVLQPGGRILVSETLLDEGRHGPPMPALLSLCMLLLTGGDNFTALELERMLVAAGFVDVGVERNASRGVRDLVRARKPQ